MKVSDNDIEGLRGAVADGHIILYVPETLVTALLDELLALRKVADAADRFCIVYNAGPARDELDALIDALRESGR